MEAGGVSRLPDETAMGLFLTALVFVGPVLLIIIITRSEIAARFTSPDDEAHVEQLAPSFTAENPLHGREGGGGGGGRAGEFEPALIPATVAAATAPEMRIDIEAGPNGTVGGIEMTSFGVSDGAGVTSFGTDGVENPLHGGGAGPVEVVGPAQVGAVQAGAALGPNDDLGQAAVKIERVARGGMARRRSKVMKDKGSAAVKIEKVVRGGIARRSSRVLREEGTAKREAAVKIEKVVRGGIARRHSQTLKGAGAGAGAVVEAAEAVVEAAETEQPALPAPWVVAHTEEGHRCVRGGSRASSRTSSPSPFNSLTHANSAQVLP